MSLKRLFIRDLNEAKLLIKRKIESEAEFVFEEERCNAYALGALEFGEDILLLTNEQKEGARLRYTRELKLQENVISGLWQKLIERTANFQVGTDIFIRVSLVAGILALIFRFTEAAIVLFIAAGLVYLFSKTPKLYQHVMYILCGSWLISDKLLEAYSKYGRMEAALYLADYRGLCRSGDDERKRWIFTPSHIVRDDDEKDP